MRHYLNAKNAILVAVLPLILILMAGTAFSQDGYTNRQRYDDIVMVNAEGDLIRTFTGNPSKVHAFGYIKLASFDYFRGVFDGVQEDLDDWSLQPTLGISFKFGENDDMSFTAGIENGISDKGPYPSDNLSMWYEANPYFGITKQLDDRLMAGLTYAIYGSPNDPDEAIPFENTEELILSLKAIRADDTVFGYLASNFKLAFRPDDGGWFVGIGIDPEIAFIEQMNLPIPMTLSVPVIAGTGFNDYYDGDFLEGFIQTGIKGTMQMNQYIPVDYGQWFLEPRIDIIFRDNSIENAGGPYDDGDNVVLGGSVALSVVY